MSGRKGVTRFRRAIGAAALLWLAVAGPAAGQEQGLVVRRVHFEGNESIAGSVLKSAISTTESSWLVRNFPGLGIGGKRRLNEQELRRDVARLRLFYQVSGFLEAEVDTAVVRTEREAFVTFRITEGRPTLLRRFDIVGLDSLPNAERILRDLPLEVGDPHNRALVEVTADTIHRRLTDRGYPTPSVLVTKREVDRERRTADVELTADAGVRARFGPIEVVGSQEVDSSFVRSLLSARTGRIYRYADVYRSQLNLYQSGLFRFATVAVDTTRFTLGDPTVPLLVQVQEGPLHRVRSGLGIGTNDCVRAEAGWTARNVGGRGRQIDFFGSVSKIGVTTDPFRSTVCRGLEEDTIGSRKINYSFNASLRRPVFLGPSNAITGTVFADRLSEYKVYLREEIGTSVIFTREGSRGVTTSLGYRLAYGATQAGAVSFCAFFQACRADDIAQLREKRVTASLTAGVIRQRTNNPVDPSRGSLASLQVTFSSPWIGSTRFSEFTRVVGEYAQYWALGSDVVLAGHLKGGLTFSPRLQLGAGAANFIPPDQRFYAGGPNDVRGFDRNELGPVVYVTTASNVDGTGEVLFADSVQVAPIGGNTTVIGNLELRLPSPILTGRLRWAMFVDMGTVWERSAANPVALQITPGVGIRFGTPLGPMRLDLAYRRSDLPRGALYTAVGDELNLIRTDYRKPRGRPFNIQFSVGQAF